jgi:hypothetical protein
MANTRRKLSSPTTLLNGYVVYNRLSLSYLEAKRSLHDIPNTT